MIGELTDQVNFVRRSRTQDANGHYTPSDMVIASVFASVKPTDAREGEQGGRLFGSTTYLVKMHADDKPFDLTTTDHLVWVDGGNVLLNIRAIRQPSPQALWLEIVAEQGAAIDG